MTTLPLCRNNDNDDDKVKLDSSENEEQKPSSIATMSLSNDASPPDSRPFDSLADRVARGQNRYGMPMQADDSIENKRKNPHAVALGKMTSPAKAKAAEANGQLGGRPKD